MGKKVIIQGTEKVRQCSLRDFLKIRVPPCRYQCHSMGKTFKNNPKLHVERIQTWIIRYERGEASKLHRLPV